MNYLLLGGSGFVGKPLKAYIEGKGHSVRCIDIANSPNQDLRHLKIDFGSVDYTLFLAWDVGGSKYLYNSSTQAFQLEWNVSLMSNVFPQLADSKIPFLFASSQLADEVDTVYGVTKRLGEHWTKVYGGSVVRFWNVYGPIESQTERSHVVSDLVFSALTKGKMELLTDGTEQRQFIHIDDLAEAVLALSHTCDKGPFDITSFEWISILEVANVISELTGAEIIPGEMKGKTQATTLSGRIPGWLPLVDLHSGLKEMISKAKRTIW